MWVIMKFIVECFERQLSHLFLSCQGMILGDLNAKVARTDSLSIHVLVQFLWEAHSIAKITPIISAHSISLLNLKLFLQNQIVLKVLMIGHIHSILQQQKSIEGINYLQFLLPCDTSNRLKGDNSLWLSSFHLMPTPPSAIETYELTIY